MTTRSADKRRSVKKEEEKDTELVESISKTEASPKTEARSKLNKALENAEAENEKEHEEENSSESEKELPMKKTKVKVEKEESSIVKEHKTKQSTQQASYIMKLFDRSVNLAKFSEDTPLYPLCRSWMLNAPRQLVVKTEKNTDSVMQAEEGDVVEMPKVRIRKGGKPIVQRKDSKIDYTDFDTVIDSEIWTKDKLFEFHTGRWTAEREKHIENYRNFEEKHFAANLELLESMIKGSEE